MQRLFHLSDRILEKEERRRPDRSRGWDRPESTTGVRAVKIGPKAGSAAGPPFRVTRALIAQ